MLARRTAAAVVLLVAACGRPASAPIATPGARPVVDEPVAAIAGPARVRFTLPRDGQPARFSSMPWPTELARRADGRLDLDDYPGADSVVTGAAVAEIGEELRSFSVLPTVYFAIEGEAPIGLGDPERRARAVALIDVDPTSPERGRRVPLASRYYPGELRFVPAKTLALRPTDGAVLRADTLYAAVVRRDVDLGGPALGASYDLEVVKRTAPRRDKAEERARALHAPAFDALARIGIARDAVAAIAVFRTGRPHETFQRLFEVATHLTGVAAPRVLRASWVGGHEGPRSAGGYRTLRGLWCTPSFQRDPDRAPFISAGGTLDLDAAGTPRVVELPATSPYRTAECGGLMRARFVLSIPAGEAPAEGWPLLVFAHGTTGDAWSFARPNDLASWAARAGIAVVSTDQPLHGGRDPEGARPGSREPLAIEIGGIALRLGGPGFGSERAFFNALRPVAVRDNLRQAAIDTALLARTVAAADFSSSNADGSPLLAIETGVGKPLPIRNGYPAPRFDERRIAAVGHSQGSFSVAVLGAVDPLLRAVVLSACGGDLTLGMVRRTELEARPAFEAALGLHEGELDEMHPLASLAQAVLDSVDPSVWAPRYADRPTNVLLFEGIGDTMTANISTDALAVALDAQPLAPALRPIAGLPRAGAAPGPVVRGNRAAGRGTAALLQLAPTRGEDGHFVLYDEPGAGDALARFVRTAFDEPPATLTR